MSRALPLVLMLAAGVVLPAADGMRFTDVTAAAGIAFTHVNGASADKHLVETMGSGGLFFDYDNDGWIDVLLVDGGSLADRRVAEQARHRLYRNRGRGTFEDVTARAGIQPRGYGQGACAADYDADGHIDLYITSFGPNALYRNRGDGTFVETTKAARVGEARWSASCAFADLDRDGDLDLFVVNYVAATAARSPYCGNARTGIRFYCHPLNYEPLPNTLYRNDGGGRFTDVSAASGIGRHRANGLGVVIADLDDDRWPDVFVANDGVANSLFRNTRNLTFEESALGAGVALATDGRARAGMGVDAGDYDGDGRLDLVVTNLDFETHSLFRNLGGGLFRHATAESGIGFATLPFVGFGVVFFDGDSDGRTDVAIANGHILDNAPAFRSGAKYAQRRLLFRGDGQRRFVEIGRTAGSGFAPERVGRGLAAGDIDNDGDLDLLVTNNGQAAELLRNDSPLANAVLVRLLAADGRRDAIGATLRVTTGKATQIRTVTAGSSYLSQHDLRLHIGLGRATSIASAEVRWPSGRSERIGAMPGNHVITIREGAGIAGTTPLTRP